jgi:hypothetical protein
MDVSALSGGRLTPPGYTAAFDKKAHRSVRFS